MTARPLEERGYQEFCDNINKASVLKSVTMGRRCQNNKKNCVTLFMDDPLMENMLNVSMISATSIFF